MTLDARNAGDKTIDTGTWFQSAASGLWYENKESAGDICAIRVNGVTEYQSEPENRSNVAICIQCGCDDYHACVDEIETPCHWLRLDRNAGRGVCSSCRGAVERWDAGDRSPAQSIVTEKGPVALGEQCWFTKSMRLCRLVEIKADNYCTVEVMDSGKRLTATPEGLWPGSWE